MTAPSLIRSAYVFFPGCLGPLKREVVLLEDHRELVARLEHAINECDQVKAENEALRSALRPLLAHWVDVKPGESVNIDNARAAIGTDDIPDFTPGNGNKARRRAEALGVDYDEAMGPGVKP